VGWLGWVSYLVGSVRSRSMKWTHGQPCVGGAGIDAAAAADDDDDVTVGLFPAQSD